MVDIYTSFTMFTGAAGHIGGFSCHIISGNPKFCVIAAHASLILHIIKGSILAEWSSSSR